MVGKGGSAEGARPGRRPEGPAGAGPSMCGSGVQAPVVNVQVAVVSGLPARSLIAAVPPVAVIRYCVLAASVAFGFRIHWFVVPLRVTTAPISALVAALRSWNVVPETPF